MAILFFFLLIITVAVGFFIDYPSALLTFLLFGSCVFLVYILSRERKKDQVKIYILSFVLSLLYTLLCYVYMKFHNYDKLLINDTEYYITTVKDYLGSNNLLDAISSIWDDYDVFVRNKAGYFTYLAILGYLSQQIGADLYFTLQLVTFSICSFGAVIIYKLLSYYFNDRKYIFCVAVLLTLLPMYFSYSTFILRDNLIALGFYYIIWLLHKPPTPSTIAKFALAVAAITMLRTESGYASIIFFPMYLLINNTKRRSSIMWFTVLGIILLIVLVINENMTSIVTVYNDNYEAYFSKEGSGTISFLSNIPVIGRILASLYGLIMPIPCWARMSTFYMPQLPYENLYNVMNFPSMFYVAFNTYLVVYLIRALFTHAYKGLNIGILKIIMLL